LNARRSVQQLSVGEYNPGTVARIGWDHHTIGGSGATNEYVFGQELPSGYIAATLVWDRLVDKTGGSTFQEGDQFFNDVLISDTNDLDLYLMPANSNDLNMAIAKSSDFDGNGTVGTEDYDTWRENFGNAVAAGTGADGNGDGTVDAADYVVWRKFADAAGSGSGGLANVPEPSCLMQLAAATMLIGCRFQK
jgi:hypothetical protein